MSKRDKAKRDSRQQTGKTSGMHAETRTAPGLVRAPSAGRQAEQEQRRRAASRQRTRRRWQIAAVAATVLIAGTIGGWLILGRSSTTAIGPDGLPGPLGGSSISQDINTLVGKAAPSFTLADSDGKRYNVVPGQGRPIVLVFHMGIT